MSFKAQSYNPGNVNVRLGVVVAGYESAFARGDLKEASNWLRLIRGHLANFMTPKQKEAYNQMPGYATGDHRKTAEVAEDMELRREYLLAIAVDKNVWARGEPEEGDASTLALTPEVYGEAPTP